MSNQPKFTLITRLDEDNLDVVGENSRLHHVQNSTISEFVDEKSLMDYVHQMVKEKAIGKLARTSTLNIKQERLQDSVINPMFPILAEIENVTPVKYEPYRSCPVEKIQFVDLENTINNSGRETKPTIGRDVLHSTEQTTPNIIKKVQKRGQKSKKRAMTHVDAKNTAEAGRTSKRAENLKAEKMKRENLENQKRLEEELKLLARKKKLLESRIKRHEKEEEKKAASSNPKIPKNIDKVGKVAKSPRKYAARKRSIKG